MNEKYYDAIINIALTNMYTLSKDTDVLVFKNLNYKQPAHKCFVEIADIARSIVGLKIEFSMSPFKFFFFKIFSKKKDFIRSKEKEGIDVDKFIEHIEHANKHPNLFIEIYNHYYKKKR